MFAVIVIIFRLLDSDSALLWPLFIHRTNLYSLYYSWIWCLGICDEQMIYISQRILFS